MCVYTCTRTHTLETEEFHMYTYFFTIKGDEMTQSPVIPWPLFSPYPT